MINTKVKSKIKYYSKKSKEEVTDFSKLDKVLQENILRHCERLQTKNTNYRKEGLDARYIEYANSAESQVIKILQTTSLAKGKWVNVVEVSEKYNQRADNYIPRLAIVQVFNRELKPNTNVSNDLIAYEYWKTANEDIGRQLKRKDSKYETYVVSFASRPNETPQTFRYTDDFKVTMKGKHKVLTMVPNQVEVFCQMNVKVFKNQIKTLHTAWFGIEFQFGNTWGKPNRELLIEFLNRKR